jgi:hypothetical protein
VEEMEETRRNKIKNKDGGETDKWETKNNKRRNKEGKRLRKEDTVTCISDYRRGLEW